MITLQRTTETMTQLYVRKLLLPLLMTLELSHSFSQPITPKTPVIAPAILSQHGIDKIMVRTQDSTIFLMWAAKQAGTLLRLSENLYEVTGKNKLSIEDLKQIPGSKYIDRANRVAKEETILGDFDNTLNGVSTVHALFPTITGQSITLSIKEKPFDVQDLDVRGRVKFNSQFDEAATLHSTLMATIAAGGGNTSPQAKGAAWGSSITTSDFSRLLPDAGTDLTSLKVSVQNHSYGVGLENYYGLESFEYDQAIIDYPKILHVFSSGNEGNQTPTDGIYSGLEGVANLTGQFKISKNTIAIGSSDRFGNVVSTSSRGPAQDGRIKPELIAFGDSGSSESAGVVSGIAALVQEKYLNQYQELPDAALVKAVLINSAIDSGRPQVDYETGFGNVDALNALRTIDAGTFFESSVNHTEEKTFAIQVPANQDELRVTLVWNDPPADPASSKALMNDLDIVLDHINTGQRWNPWILNATPSVNSLQESAFRGSDRLNNVEQITLTLPQEGLYEINVTGFDVPQGPQKFFLVYEFRQGFEWTFPQIDNAIDAQSNTLIRWRWHGSETIGTLAYRFYSDSEWTIVESDLDLHASYYEWSVPDSPGLFQLRITVGSENYESVVFPVSKPDRVKVGFNCEDEFMLLWNKVPEAESYVLYALGDRYLEPFKILSDTVAVIKKSETNQYFSVAPVMEGKTGLRELTINYEEQGTSCYLISFRSRQYLVSDTAYFELELGTTYQLQSIILERFSNGAFQPIETVNPTNRNITLNDPLPLSGITNYRVRLITDSQQIIVSQFEEVFYAKEMELYVYPNPIFRGDELNVVINTEEAAIIRIYDLHGRLIRGVEDTGAFKSMDLSDFKAGTYLVRVFKHDGTILTTRLLIL